VAHILILAEKPSAALEVAHALLGVPKDRKARSYSGVMPNGDRVTVGAFRGHVLELADPTAYSATHGKDYSKWHVADLPILPNPGWKFTHIIRPDARDVVATVRELVEQHSGHEIVNACDAGREGELIFRKGLSACKVDRASTKFTRMWYSSMTTGALQKSFNERKPQSSYDGLARAGYCRDQADWLVGMNKTRLASKTLPKGQGEWKVWSVGRVQTPTLALIVERDLLIENFVSDPFWEAVGMFGDVEAAAVLKPYGNSPDRSKLLGTPRVLEEDAKVRFWSKDCADAFARAAMDEPRYKVTDIAKARIENPPLPFDLQEAQKFCAKNFGLKPAETLQLLQELYEAKLISYPRTDSRHFPEDMRAQVYENVKAALAAVKQLYPQTHISLQPLMPRVIADKSKAFNDAKVSDHYALCPVETAGLGSLTNTKLYAYLGILQAAVMSLDEPAKFSVIERRWQQIAGTSPYFPAAFWNSAEALAHAGWTRWRRPSDKEKKILPALASDEAVLDKVVLVQAKTTPPKHYADDTILDAMLLAGARMTAEQFSADPAKLEEMMALLKDKGIGTPATRASIIETLEDRGYIKREKKSLRATENGRLLISCLRERDAAVVSAALTAEWESELKRMEKGTSTMTREAFLQSVLDQFLSVKDGFIANSTRNDASSKLTVGTPIPEVLCPKSKKPMIDRGEAFEAPGFEGTLLWKNAFGRAWTASDYARLLEGVVANQPVEFKELVSKEGRTYSAPLTLDPKAKKVVIHAIEEKLKGVKCPKSKKDVIDRGKFWICPGWPNLKLYKESLGRTWTIEQYLEILSANLADNVQYIDGLVGKSGRPFSAKLKISSETAERFEFEFPPRAA
jgi:DNA topoisomerase III